MSLYVIYVSFYSVLTRSVYDNKKSDKGVSVK